MARNLAGLEVDLTNVDITSSYATYSQSEKKSQIPDAAGENNLPCTQASNSTNDDKTVTSSNLCLPPRGSLELISLRDASQNSTRMQCYFHHLWKIP